MTSSRSRLLARLHYELVDYGGQAKSTAKILAQRRREFGMMEGLDKPNPSGR